MTDCGACYGRKFIRTADGRWTPCPTCYWASVSTSYVKPMVKQNDGELPRTLLTEEAWPLTDRVETGDYQVFRHRVWRALLHYYPTGLTYDYFEAWRLTEIQFEREQSEYTTLRDFSKLGLLVLVTGIADPPNSYTMPLVRYVTELRTMHGKPTWVYARSRAALTAPAKDAPTLPLPTKPAARKQIF